MANWLFKSEPDCYSYDNLVKEKKTWWTGVANALARKHLRAVEKGDRVWFYQTGDDKAIVGEMIVTHGPQPDPVEDDPKSVVVEVKPVRKLNRPVTLAEIKANVAFAGWELIKNSRLSVMPVTDDIWEQIEKLAE